MTSESATQSVERALYSTAGLLQATLASAPRDVAGKPDYATVHESDLQIALASSLQAQVGARVRREASVAKVQLIPPLASGYYGTVDVVVLDPDASTHAVYLECKWCAEDKLWWTLWDAVKLAHLGASPNVQACYLVCGAPSAGWETHVGRPVELFTDVEHQTAALLTQYDKAWKNSLAASKARPSELPASFTTGEMLELPIHLPDGPSWLLRAVRITVEPGAEMLSMSADGYPILRSSA